MRLKDTETTKEKEYRQKVVLSETKRSVPLVLIVVVALIAMLCMMYLNNAEFKAKQNGIGDPYHCMDCKSAGFACKEHRGFDGNAQLNTMVGRFVANYTFGSDGIAELYGSGNKYNKDCDYCLSEQAECYGCSYDRNTIREMAEQVTKDEIFISKLCDKCWEFKYAQCSNCRALLKEEIQLNMVS